MLHLVIGYVMMTQLLASFPDNLEGRTVRHEKTTTFLGQINVSNVTRGMMKEGVLDQSRSVALQYLSNTSGISEEYFVIDSVTPSGEDFIVRLSEHLYGLPVEGAYATVLVGGNSVRFANYSLFAPMVLDPIFVVDQFMAEHSAKVEALGLGMTVKNILNVSPVIFTVRSDRAYVSWNVTLSTTEPPATWNIYVHAQDNIILGVKRTSTDLVEGVVKFPVEHCQGQTPELQAIPHIQWAHGLFTTDAGTFSSAAFMSRATIELKSPYFSFNDEKRGTMGGPWQFALGPSPSFNALEVDKVDFDQIDPFFHLHRVRGWLTGRLVDKNQQKAWTEATVAVNINLPRSCNAFYSPSEQSLNFFQEGSGCQNTGRVAGIIYHEYGHSIHDHSAGPLFDIQVSEGVSDYIAATMSNNPNLAGIFSCEQPFRSSVNTLTYCDSGCDLGPNSEVHDAGQVISAVWWELRQQLIARYGYDLGTATTDRVFLKFLTLVGDMSSSYDAAIAADDDDDGTALNGTRHSCEINKAFANDAPGSIAHFPRLKGKIPSAPVITLRHEPKGFVEASPTSVLELDVFATVSQGCVNSGSALEVMLYYSGSKATKGQVRMAPDPENLGAHPNERRYVAGLNSISAPQTLTYYVVAKLGSAEFHYPYQGAIKMKQNKEPVYQQTVRFAPKAVDIYGTNFEDSDGGLVAGRALATMAMDWEWGHPNGLGGDPTEPHSGRKIWGTDLANQGDGQYTRGQTSYLDLPVLDLSTQHDVRLQFWRQLLNADVAQIEVNGRRVFENRAGGYFWRDPVWTFQDIDISAQAAGESEVRIRFIMKDEFKDSFELGGWNIDDVKVVGDAVDAGTSPADHKGSSRGLGCTSTGDTDGVWIVLSVACVMFSRKRWGLFKRLGVVPLIASIACTDAQLMTLASELQVQGTACTMDPGVVVFPYKILFVIDLSRSNQQSDPQDKRAEAVRKVIEQYAENRAVSFGVIGFSEAAEAITAGFTRDRSTLVPGVVESLRRDISGTNYLGAMDLAVKFIREDADKLTDSERARTRYDVQWVSDGIPDPCQQPDAILGKEKELLGLVEKYGLFELKVNTTQLAFNGFGGYTVENCEQFKPDDYLRPMARGGFGQFQALAAEDLKFEIDFSEIYRRFEKVDFFVVNENRMVFDDQLWPDSDGDGLRDDDKTREPDALRVDHDFDGCSDRVDDELLPNVGLCHAACAGRMQGGDPQSLVDLDSDGLPDCAEQTLGYHRLRSDSDGDGLGDDIELRFGTNPLDKRTPELDSDRDGALDAEEIRLGTDPRRPENHGLFSYRYSPLYANSEVESKIQSGVSCFDFTVDNVKLVQTLATRSSVSGGNRICAYLVQRPSDDPQGPATVMRACKSAIYNSGPPPTIVDPLDRRLEFQPKDFQFLY